MKRDGAAAAHVSPARLAAAEVLLLVGEGRGHSDDLLHGRALQGLSASDRNLATALVLGVLRWQIALDAQIRQFLQRPDAKLAAPLEVALRMGAFQLRHMDRIPPHAALSESVELARAGGHAHAAGMVNAVLRKLVSAPPPGRKLHETVPVFAERLGHPAWMVERWVKVYGRAAALAIGEADQQEPNCGNLFSSQHGAPVMDDGSRLVAELAARCAPGAQRVWDCCAAPGGKTVVLAKRLETAQIVAMDVSPARARNLASRMEREQVQNVRVEVADATKSQHEGEFNLVLCDVPCSGTGTLGRNPEIRHRLKPEELSRHATRQGEILQAAVESAAPGGRVVYSTCSLEREECEDVVAQALAAHAGKLRQVNVNDVLQDLKREGRLSAGADIEVLQRDGALRTLPGVGFDGDGFYAVILERAAK